MLIGRSLAGAAPDNRPESEASVIGVAEGEIVSAAKCVSADGRHSAAQKLGASRPPVARRQQHRPTRRLPLSVDFFARESARPWVSSKR